MAVEITGRYRLERFPYDNFVDKRYAGRLHAVRVTGPATSDSVAVFQGTVSRADALIWMSDKLQVPLASIVLAPETHDRHKKSPDALAMMEAFG